METFRPARPDEGGQQDAVGRPHVSGARATLQIPSIEKADPLEGPGGRHATKLQIPSFRKLNARVCSETTGPGGTRGDARNYRRSLIKGCPMSGRGG